MNKVTKEVDYDCEKITVSVHRMGGCNRAHITSHISLKSEFPGPKFQIQK